MSQSASVFLVCRQGSEESRRNDNSSLSKLPSLPVPFTIPWTFSPLLLAILSLLNLLFPGYSTEMASLPFIVSLFIFGMPHGASDFARLREYFGADDWTRVLAPFSLYLAGMGGVIVILLLQPAFALFAFAVLSAWHFGRSDLHGTHTLEKVDRIRMETRGFRFLRIVSRGILLIALPIALDPSAVVALANEWMGILSGTAISTRRWESVASTAHTLAWGALTGQLLVLLVFAARRRSSLLRREMVEASSLILALTLLDPVFVLGAYFLLWHGLRHLRFEASMKAGSPAVWLEMCGLDKRASILLIPTLAVYFGLSFYLFPAWNPLGQVALLLIFFAVVTPSHEFLNAYLCKSGTSSGNPPGM